MEPGEADPQDRAGQGMRHPVHGPLVGDEAGQHHFVASLTQRTTDRFKTSRSIRSWAFSARRRFSSETSPVESPCVPSCSARSLATQLPRVPGCTPRSRAIWAIGLPVSRTMLTAPSRNSGSNFLRESGMTTPHSPCLHGFGGCPPRAEPANQRQTERLANRLVRGTTCVPSTPPRARKRTATEVGGRCRVHPGHLVT